MTWHNVNINGTIYAQLCGHFVSFCILQVFETCSFSRVLIYWWIHVDDKLHNVGGPGSVLITFEDTEVSGGENIQIY